MKKIWAKIINDHKIIDDYLLVLHEFNIENLYEYLKEICYNLKTETPIILPKHKNQMEEYGTTKFTSENFIDYINYDYLSLEYFED